jgi:hypothetical protein
MGLLYLLVGLACGVAVGMGIKKREAAAIDETAPESVNETAPESANKTTPAPINKTTVEPVGGIAGKRPHENDASEPPKPPRFPDVEYDLEPEDL